jgi:phosphatidylglycerol lysyltransferase
MVTHELASIFAVGNNSIFLDTETKTQIALGDPKRLLAECPDPIEEFRNFEPSSLRTLRWREPDSNHRSRVRKSGRCQVPAIRPGAGRTLTLGGGAESSLESRDIELLVSPKDIRTSPYDLCANRSDRRQSREGDRWFESTSLQRRVSDASRFLRASVAVAVIALAAAALHLLASATTQSGIAGRSALTRAAEIVAQSPEARANLALLGDKRILFHPAGDGFVMFGIVRRSWVVLGDPIGPFARWRDLLCQLITDATSQGGWPVFFGVGEAAAKICSKVGFAVWRIGDQAILPLHQFAIEKLSPELREAHRQIASLGCRFEVVASEAVPALIRELLSISEDWLRGKRTRQRAFPSIALRVDYLGRFPVGVVRSGGRILAFGSLVGSAGKAELSIEFVRYVANMPTGILDFVLVEAILWAKGQGYRTVNLGLTPPRGLGRRDTVSRWTRFGAQLYRHGEHYSDFNELRRAKARFAPRWDPRFVSSRPGLALARAIPDLAKLVAGSSMPDAARKT